MWARIIRTAPRDRLAALIEESVQGMSHGEFVEFLTTVPEWWRY